MGCLCQHEGVGIRDHATFHGHHQLFQHQYQCLGGKVSALSNHLKLTSPVQLRSQGRDLYVSHFLGLKKKKRFYHLYFNYQVRLVDVLDSVLTVN